MLLLFHDVEVCEWWNYLLVIVLCVFSEDKQRSPYALNTAGDAADDQDGDSRYSTTNE